MPEKPKLSIYWASSCGGCEAAVLNLHERILELDAAFEFVFCPCLFDSKRSDLEALPDGAIAVTLFNGAIRTVENREMALLLRKKSRTLVAFGACAYGGGVPALANLSPEDEIMDTVSPENPSACIPSNSAFEIVCDLPEGKLHLPSLFGRVASLRDITEVDYFMPGCPPEPARIWDVFDSLANRRPLPLKGAIIGAGISSVCDECERERGEKRIKKLFRPHEIIPAKGRCLLDQGIICMGVATASGCGGLCPAANMPCTGCYGPPEGVLDQGAKMISALGAALDIDGIKGSSEYELAEKVDAALNSIPDLAGTFYKYSLSQSLLKGRRG